MQMRLKLLAATGALCLAAAGVNASAIIGNGTIGLGVTKDGHLGLLGGPPSAAGTETYGLRDLRTGFEGTAAGCLCEGWGISDGVTGWGHRSTPWASPLWSAS